MKETTSVTDLLASWGSGNSEALNKLFPVIYSELKKIARGLLSHERSDHTMQTTELVHEAYLRLYSRKNTSWENRRRFFAFAAQVMRHFLIDQARIRKAKRRGGGNFTAVGLDEEIIDESFCVSMTPEILLSLDQALKQLSHLEPRSTQIAELRLFGGLAHDDISEILGISLATVKRDWAIAKRYLAKSIILENESKG